MSGVPDLGRPVYGWPNTAVEWTFQRRRRSAVALVAVHVLWLVWMQRPLLCSGGDTFLWPPAGTPHNSQHLADWYSLLHVGFGMTVALLLAWMRPHWRLRDRALVALISSTVWEMVENTQALIALLSNAGSVAPDYFGDSIVNSLADSLFTLCGFWAASRLGWRSTLVLVALLEVAVSLAIKDGWLLTLVRLLTP